MRRERGKQLPPSFKILIFVMRKSISATKSKKKTSQRSEQQGPLIDPKPISEEPKSPFDFGGLPSRDVKKNLGCG